MLPDVAPVIRGGVMGLGDLMRAAERCEVQLGRPGLSVFAADVLDASELLALCTLNYNKMRVSTAGRVRAAGFEIEQTKRWPHHTIWIPDGDREPLLKTLMGTFDAPVTIDVGGE